MLIHTNTFLYSRVTKIWPHDNCRLLLYSVNPWDSQRVLVSFRLGLHFLCSQLCFCRFSSLTQFQRRHRTRSISFLPNWTAVCTRKPINPQSWCQLTAFLEKSPWSSTRPTKTSVRWFMVLNSGLWTSRYVTGILRWWVAVEWYLLLY